MKYIINLKSTYYFLKNLVFTLFCIALGFLLGSGILKARAASAINIDISESLVTSSGYDFTSDIEALDEALENTGLPYLISLGYLNGSYQYIHVYVYKEKVPELGFFEMLSQLHVYPNYSKYYQLSACASSSLSINDINFSKMMDYINNGFSGCSVSSDSSFQPLYRIQTNGVVISTYSTGNGIEPTNVSTTHDYVINGTTYTNGDTLPTYKDLYLSGPKLSLKNSFNSGTNAPLTSKIIWNINVNTDLSTLDGILNFKLQYGSNDFTSENIPNFLRYKMYGKNTSESEWTEINNHEQIYFDDFIYEYYDSEIFLNGVLNLPSDMCIYEQIQVEFYFDNTINFYMYVYDDLDNSTWSDVQKYFENYRLYEFPTNKKYAFISHSENIENQGRIYVPYNAIINTDILLNAYIYDFSINNTTLKLLPYSFEEETYYNYFDFTFSFDNNKVLMLQRKKSEEKLYFYVPNDYIVQFFDEKENNQIITPDGYVDIESDDINNIYDDESNSIFDYFNNFIDVNNPFFIKINDVWELLKTSKIFDYIMLLIVGTLIIILISAINR